MKSCNSSERGDQDYDARFGNEDEIDVFIEVEGRFYRQSEGAGVSRGWVERQKEAHRRWLGATDERVAHCAKIGFAFYCKLAALMDELGAETVGDCQ